MKRVQDTQLGIKGKDLITMGNLKYAYKPDQNIKSNNDLKILIITF